MASEDLTGRSAGKGIKPGVLQSLFGGGVAKGGNGDSDLRSGRAAAKPGEGRMLFKGGPAASSDLRTGKGDEHPEMLDEGGEADGVSDAEVVAAEEIMDCLKGGSYGLYITSAGDNDSKMEKAGKDAARKAHAKVLAQALKSFFQIVG